MHIPTPHLHRTAEKRKASIDSVAHSDHSAVEPKAPKSKKKDKAKKKTKVSKKDKEVMARSTTPEVLDADERAHTRSISPSSPVPETALSEAIRTSSLHAPPTLEEEPEAEQTQEPSSPASKPRRSSRLRTSLTSVSATWDKARPYIERINGTIMPLEPQGTKVYYAKDGIRVD